jgi:hypothetical protein
MIYNPEKRIDVQRAVEKIKYFISKNQMFELKQKRVRRTISQNGYLHLLFGWFALETGYTSDEVKQDIFKKVVNPSTFYEGEFGEIIKIERWRSTKELDTVEMNLCIDRFRDYSAKEAGIYLPEPSDLPLIRQIELEIENNKQYL